MPATANGIDFNLNIMGTAPSVLFWMVMCPRAGCILRANCLYPSHQGIGVGREQKFAAAGESHRERQDHCVSIS
jgi:hypothetical protein